MSSSKVATMHDAIADLVRDGDTVAIEGFTHLISFAAGHEIIRQGRRDLTLARLTPDLIYDQMVAAGVARSSSSRGSATRASAGSARSAGGSRARSRTQPLEVEEYSHFGMVGRYTAGAMNLPFFPLRSYFETDLPVANPLIRPIASPYGDETVYAVPPLRPDVTIVHAQRASAGGDTQVWGLLGCQKEAAFAAERVIVVVEELVDEAVIRADPNRTIIPGLIVDAVVVEPWGAHPSYVQGAYDRDNRFYRDWDAITPGRGDDPGLAARMGLRRSTAGPPTSRSSGPSGSRTCEPGHGAVRHRRLRGVPLMATTVRYMVADVDRSVAFYRDQLGFEVVDQMGGAFARVGRGDLSVWLSGPASSAARPMPDGRQPTSGGWNRFVIEVDDLAGAGRARCKAAGATRSGTRS